MRSLEGRVAIVSGAGEGIGRSCALALARDGADIALGARRGEQLARVADEVRALGRQAAPVPTDITVPGQCHALVERAATELGRVDAVVDQERTRGRIAGDGKRGRSGQHPSQRGRPGCGSADPADGSTRHELLEQQAERDQVVGVFGHDGFAEVDRAALDAGHDHGVA